MIRDRHIIPGVLPAPQPLPLLVIMLLVVISRWRRAS
jgi:hypothetical protein